jgi:hypothetical protein
MKNVRITIADKNTGHEKAVTNDSHGDEFLVNKIDFIAIFFITDTTFFMTDTTHRPALTDRHPIRIALAHTFPAPRTEVDSWHFPATSSLPAADRIAAATNHPTSPTNYLGVAVHRPTIPRRLHSAGHW